MRGCLYIGRGRGPSEGLLNADPLSTGFFLQAFSDGVKEVNYFGTFVRGDIEPLFVHHIHYHEPSVSGPTGLLGICHRTVAS